MNNLYLQSFVYLLSVLSFYERVFDTQNSHTVKCLSHSFCTSCNYIFCDWLLLYKFFFCSFLYFLELSHEKISLKNTTNWNHWLLSVGYNFFWKAIYLFEVLIFDNLSNLLFNRLDVGIQFTVAVALTLEFSIPSQSDFCCWLYIYIYR